MSPCQINVPSFWDIILTLVTFFCKRVTYLCPFLTMCTGPKECVVWRMKSETLPCPSWGEIPPSAVVEFPRAVNLKWNWTWWVIAWKKFKKRNWIISQKTPATGFWGRSKNKYFLHCSWSECVGLCTCKMQKWQSIPNISFLVWMLCLF